MMNMLRVLFSIVILSAMLGVSGLALAHPHGVVDANFRPQALFAAYDVYVDSGDAQLAAYQIEISAPGGGALFVGIEGGEHKAFSEPPFYDPRALQDGERIILAALSTAEDLPSGRTRVARLHVREMRRPIDLSSIVIVAGGVDGNEIKLSVQITRHGDNGGEFRR